MKQISDSFLHGIEETRRVHKLKRMTGVSLVFLVLFLRVDLVSNAGRIVIVISIVDFLKLSKRHLVYGEVKVQQ
jgi:hypothetical protein